MFYQPKYSLLVCFTFQLLKNLIILTKFRMTQYHWRETKFRNFSCRGLSRYSSVSHDGGLASIPGRACGICNGLSSFYARLSWNNSHFLSLYSSANSSYPFIHSFILSLSSRFNNTTVCHIQFEINAQLLTNLCTCVRIFISLFYIGCEAKVNTCCRL